MPRARSRCRWESLEFARSSPCYVDTRPINFDDEPSLMRIYNDMELMLKLKLMLNLMLKIKSMAKIPKQ